MTDLRKAAEMALEALEELRFANAPFLDEAMEALRTALAQPEQECIYPECETGIGCDGPCGEKPVDAVKQEPMAWMNPRNNAVIDARKKKQIGEGDGYPRFSVPLYAPPKREWSGLSVSKAEDLLGEFENDPFEMLFALDKYLREKNT